MQTETELIKIGVGFLDTNKPEKAIEFFTQAIELSSKNSESFELRGIAWYRILNIEQALADTSKAIEIDNQNHRAWYNKGEILKYQKKNSEAEYCYLKADEIYPDNFYYLTGLILVSRALKKYTAAIAFCDQILKEKPHSTFSLLNRGMCLSLQLNYSAAIKDYLKLIDIGKRDAAVYNNLGYWYSKIGELKKASNNLSVALQFNSTHPYALDNLGHVKYLEGNYKEAIELINKALEIDPSNSYGYKNRALVYIKMQQKDLAIADLQKAKILGYTEDYDNEVEELLKNF